MQPAQDESDGMFIAIEKYDVVEDALVNLVAELRQQVDRGKLGSGWMVTHVPAFFKAEEMLR